MRKMAVAAAVSVSIAVGIAAPAWADKTFSEKGRTVYHFVKTELMPVGDVAGHAVGVADTRGLTLSETGDVAAYSSKIMFDIVNGSGAHQTYAITTYPDKSTVYTTHQGTTTAHADGTSTFDGTTTILCGTGRYAGAHGTGSYTGKRLAPLTPGGPADAYVDYVSNFVMPSD